jgi:hypothetical protein
LNLKRKDFFALANNKRLEKFLLNEKFMTNLTKDQNKAIAVLLIILFFQIFRDG